ncbi:MAG: type II toxin-antitoxin system PemK/MazF family toxin [Thiothrix sp.]|jgi:mRNA interferase MazF|uniref:type II toxin-antitoxin system PemK/MazF family toxin n=1 Tax=Thiothrix sp. TaxID=1032 RepID=UPI00260CE44C|nr:type II toxin-antitoxin system PemK/MazF family toxin [Thiothrix sp.]MDD5392538.1 type II toxin-antitoxin system PemK/MazF family toxin [Thiothrix sp.]
MKRGEIRWYTFKEPDKRRPVMILIRSDVIPHLGEVTIAPITTTIRDIPSEVVLSTKNGMPRDCAINFDHIQTVQKGKLGALITTLSASKLQEVDQAVSFALSLDDFVK